MTELGYYAIGAGLFIAAIFGGFYTLFSKYRRTAQDNTRLVQENETLTANQQVSDDHIEILVDRNGYRASDSMRNGQF